MPKITKARKRREAPKERESLTIYYHPEEQDLARMINQLSKQEGSQYYGRTASQIGAMVLGTALEVELEKLKAGTSSVIAS